MREKDKSSKKGKWEERDRLENERLDKQLHALTYPEIMRGEANPPKPKDSLSTEASVEEEDNKSKTKKRLTVESSIDEESRK